MWRDTKRAPLSWEEPTGWPDDAVRDNLIGDWHIYQRKGGHKTSTDDLITAWYATHRSSQRPRRYLDLGCGVGSVLLMVCHRLRPEEAHGVEAQPQSVAMARRAIDELPPHDCSIEVHASDFRSFAPSEHGYDLITGSPPYFPLHTGVLPDDAQRRACRFEARGGVEAYLETAARLLAADARCYLVFQTLGRDRVLAAAESNALHVTGQADFLMRTDRREPFLSVFELAREAAPSPHRFRCAVRQPNGELTPAYASLRDELRALPE